MSKPNTDYWKVVSHEKEGYAELFLYGMIGQDRRWSEERKEETLTDLVVVQKLRELEKNFQRINVRINSPGGSVSHGDPIVNALRSSNAEIHTYADGVVASMAADIWVAGKHRHMSLNSKLMFHSISTGVYGNAMQLMEAAELIHKMDEVAIAAFAADTGMSADDVRSKFYDYKDHWLTPNEALDMGLISEIDDYKVEPIAAEPEKMAYGELVKLYEPEADIPTQTLREKFTAFAEKIFTRAADQKPAPDQSTTKTSEQMKIEDLKKSLLSEARYFRFRLRHFQYQIYRGDHDRTVSHWFCSS